MGDTSIAKIFMSGRSKAVRLLRAFGLPGTQARVRRVGNGVLLEPIITDVDTWLISLDAFANTPFMPEGREQPPSPAPEALFA